MKAKVICMASAKGGTGKTVLTAAFCDLLVNLNKKVLMIDMDSSTNGLTLLYLKEVMIRAEYAISENRDPIGVYQNSGELMLPEVTTLKSGVDLIPATYKFYIEPEFSADSFKIPIIKVIQKLKESYDYIFLDAQAGSDSTAAIAMDKDVSDEVVIVSEYDPMSSAGIERLKGLFRENLTFDRTWILLNKMLPEFVKSFSDFLEVAKYLNPIPWDAEVVKAYARRRLALDVEHGNEYTLALIQTLKTMLGDEITKDIEDWIKKRENILKKPIKLQYNEAKRELANLLDIERNMQIKNAKRKVLLISLQASLIIATIFTYLVYFNPDWFKSLSFNISVFVFVALAMIATTYFVLYKGFFAGRFNSEIGSDLEVRKNVLMNKLTKLEALKDADLETFLHRKNEI